MKHLSKALTLLVGFILSMNIHAQIFSDVQMFKDHEVFLGFGGGLDWTNIDGIGTSFGHSRFAPSTFSVESSRLLSRSLDFYILYGFKDSDGFLNLDISYLSPQYQYDTPLEDGQLFYSDIDGLDYMVSFPHQHLRIRFGGGIYVTRHIFLQFGFDWGINTTKNQIIYRSNDDFPGRDLEIQGELERYVSGQNNISFLYGGGLNLPIGKDKALDKRRVHIFASLLFRNGLNDGLLVTSNPYFLENNFNQVNGHSVKLGIRYRFTHPD